MASLHSYEFALTVAVAFDLPTLHYLLSDSSGTSRRDYLFPYLVVSYLPPLIPSWYWVFALASRSQGTVRTAAQCACRAMMHICTLHDAMYNNYLPYLPP